MVEDTLAALQNPSALLENLREPLAAIYQELLAQAKMEKAASARSRVRSHGTWAGGWEMSEARTMLHLEVPKLLRETSWSVMLEKWERSSGEYWEFRREGGRRGLGWGSLVRAVQPHDIGLEVPEVGLA